MHLYGYRVLENDEDGDPLDHGVVRAMSMETALQLVREHLKKLTQYEDMESVRIYGLKDRNTSGVLESSNEGYKTFPVG